jgi:hypothetical protein
MSLEAAETALFILFENGKVTIEKKEAVKILSFGICKYTSCYGDISTSKK